MKIPKSGNNSDKAVIYARFSSHNQRDASIDQQVEMCSKAAEKLGLSVIQIYPDKAITGKTDNRPEFQKMMAAAKTGAFGYVIAWKSNRMGRNMLEAMINDATLQDEGVKTIYVEEDFEDNAAGRFALRNMMNVNQFYSESMAEDVRRGMMDNAKKCMVNGRIPYGYRKGQNGKAEIDPEQAAIVKEIFERVRDGWHHIDIMEDLNSRHVKNRYGRPWQRSAFDKLLRNEAYIGVYKFSDVRIEDGMPAILDPTLFEQVQHILKTKKNPRGRHRSNEEYLLTGKLFCGECGSRMVGICGTGRSGKKHYYYICQGKHIDRKCKKKNVEKRKIESTILDFLKSFVLNDETVDWLLEGLENLQETLIRKSALPAMEAEHRDIEKAIVNILTATEQGIFTERTKDRLLELEQRQAELKEQIEEEKKKFRQINPDMMRYAIRKFREGHIDDPIYKRDLIRTFIKQVFVYDDRLLIFPETNDGESIEIPLEKLSEIANIDMSGASDCINNSLPHQHALIQTVSIIAVNRNEAFLITI